MSPLLSSSAPRIGAYEAAVLTDSPNLYSKLGALSGTQASDLSGNNRFGTFAGGYVLGDAGPFSYEDSYAMRSGTSGARCEMPYNPFSGSRTFEGWFYPLSTAAVGVLFGGMDTTTYPKLSVAAAGVNMSWKRDNSNAAAATWTGLGIVVNTWYYYVLLDNPGGNTVELYLNNVSKGSKALSIGYGTTGNLQVGRGGAANTFNGRNAHFATYTGLLSSGRIAAHYAARTGP